MKPQLAILVLFILTSNNSVNCKNLSVKIDRNVDIYKKYAQVDIHLRQFVETTIKKLSPYVSEASEHVHISPTCRNNLVKFVSGIRKLSDWSISFLDATGKPQSGILSGNVQMYGESNQCFDTVVKKKGEIDFRGKYCVLLFKPIFPASDYCFEEFDYMIKNTSGLFKFILSKLYIFNMFDGRVGMCVPSGCTKEDISQMLNYLTDNSFVNATVRYCIEKEEMPSWNNVKIFALCIFAVFGIVLIISTILDNTLENWKTNKLGLPARILQCFSITRNFPKLFNTEVSRDAITCFYGIRVLSVFWIIMCHEFLLAVMASVANHALNGLPFMQSFFSQIVLNGFTATEVFFLMGGFVNCYVRVKIQKSGKPQPSVWKIIIHRLWRIYPTLFIGFLMLILLSDVGAMFYEEQKRTTEICRQYFWKNILFINNFYKPFDVCLPHTWYLCADMQLFLLSLITVPVLLRKEKFGLYLHIGIIFIANIGCFLWWWIEKYPPSPALIPFQNLSNMNSRFFETQAGLYMLPFLHIASYYIGLVLGYVVACKKEKKFTKTFTILGWLAASFFYTSIIFMTYRWNSGTFYSTLESSLYASISKSTVVLSVAWMVYCCITGQARFINYILSLKMWMPLSRLTFTMYIVSLILQTHYISNLNFPPDFSNMFLIWSYFGNLSITMILCLALVLLIESPFLALEKIFFQRNKDESKLSHTLQKETALNGTKEIELKEIGNIATIR